MQNSDNTLVVKDGEFFPHIEDTMKYGVFSYFLDKDHTEWSRGMYSIIGADPNSVDSDVELLFKLIVPGDVERISMTKSMAFRERKNFKVEFSINDLKGNLKRLLVHYYLKPSIDTSIEYYEGLAIDITEKYNYQKTLENKIHQLDKSNEDLEEFAYVASHDLQEPLRKISTYSDRLLTNYGQSLDELGNKYIQKIVASCDNMRSLLDDLLNFARISFDDKNFEKVDLQQLIDEIVLDFDIKIQETNATVKYNNLPIVEGFKSQLRQVFTNLMQNALKFKREMVPVVIEVKSREITEKDYPELNLNKNISYIAIDFIDNGIGFDQEYSDKIFMIFQRLHSKVEFNGSGIGLSICKKIVENHNGFIFAEGDLNKGAKFTVLLPKNQL